VDINTLNRNHGQTPAKRTVAPLVAEPKPVEAEVLNARLLRDAVREAGLFQRSVLGHLDHKEWRDRVRLDGQRLIDLLSEIGFTPSNGISQRPTRKSA
jgi:hypothetical protein